MLTYLKSVGVYIARLTHNRSGVMSVTSIIDALLFRKGINGSVTSSVTGIQQETS